MGKTNKLKTINISAMKKTIVLIGMALIIFAGCKKDSDDDSTPGPQAKEGTELLSTVGGSAVYLTIDEASGSDVRATISYGGDEIANIQGSITSSGMSDYVYSNGDKSKPFKLVNYDDKVGTTWSYNVGTQKVTRSVTYKSSTDDTYVSALGFYIKIMEVTEEIPSGINVYGEASGVQQIVWQFNHKFGFVGARVTKNNGSVVNVPLQYTNVQY